MNDPKKKFLFDLNNFDAGNEANNEPVEELVEEEIEPPAPTFSEEELEASKTVAHSMGITEGLSQARDERDQEIAATLKTISDSFSSLFAAETYRERQYEEEAIKLGIRLITILAPSLNDSLGEHALKSALMDVLKKQSKQSELRLEVTPESAPDVDKFIETLWPDPESAPRYKVVANSEIEKGACEIHWQDGGMIRDPDKTAKDIKHALQALLGEQVITNPPSPLTDDENNAINEEQTSDSLEQNAEDHTAELKTQSEDDLNGDTQDD